MDALFAGVDGGGTRTRAVVAGPDLLPLGRGASGPSNAAVNPLPRVVESITEAVADALAAAGAPAEALRKVTCGVAGVGSSPALKGRLAAALEPAYGAGRVLVETDARIALAGALANPLTDAGVILISGTGAIAFGRNSYGLEERAGGWGSVIGDEGSGSEIGRKGLAAVARELDGRGPRTAMREALFAAEGTRSTVDLLHHIYRAGPGHADVAAYFPLVLDAARRGDAAALAILREAGEALGETALTVLRKLGIVGDPVPVATIGGVFSAGELILAPLRERLLGGAPRVRLGPPAHPPEIGAIRLALASEESL